MLITLNTSSSRVIIHKMKILKGIMQAEKKTTTVVNMETTCLRDLRTFELSATTLKEIFKKKSRMSLSNIGNEILLCVHIV